MQEKDVVTQWREAEGNRPLRVWIATKYTFFSYNWTNYWNIVV